MHHDGRTLGFLLCEIEKVVGISFPHFRVTGRDGPNVEVKHQVNDTYPHPTPPQGVKHPYLTHGWRQ